MPALSLQLLCIYIYLAGNSNKVARKGLFEAAGLSLELFGLKQLLGQASCLPLLLPAKVLHTKSLLFAAVAGAGKVFLPPLFLGATSWKKIVTNPSGLLRCCFAALAATLLIIISDLAGKGFFK